MLLKPMVLAALILACIFVCVKAHVHAPLAYLLIYSFVVRVVFVDFMYLVCGAAVECAAPWRAEACRGEGFAEGLRKALRR